MKLYLILPLVLLAACDKDVRITYFTPENVIMITQACTAAGGYIEQTSTKAEYPYRIICTAAPPKEKVELEKIVPPANP